MSPNAERAANRLLIQVFSHEAPGDVPAANHRMLWLEELTAHPLSVNCERLDAGTIR
jgi:hypothetical protein